MQTEKQLDKRQQRSRKLLGEAIISLILEQGYENITIKSITERADVAYVTFFRHFESIDHLLSWVLEESINALVQMHEQSLNDETRSAPECFIQEGLLIFEHVAQ
ncbi:MAG: TetR/AcrR family transcriptional regulator, partial [Chloroflexi bacterium]